MLRKIDLIFFIIFFSSITYASRCDVSSFHDELFLNKLLTDPRQIQRQESDAMSRYPNDSVIRPASNSPSISWTDPNFLNYMYHKQTHLYDWDEFPGIKAKESRVTAIDPTQRRDIKIPINGGTLDTFEVGHSTNPDFAVIFIHGAGGNKTLGVNDWTFGGNFNRLQNLVINNNGVYYSPTVTHDAQGVEAIGQLMAQIKQRNPNTKIILACGSAGGAICTGISESENHVNRLDGLINVGSANAPTDIVNTPAYRHRIPTLFSHGSYDGVMSWEEMKKRYDALKAADPNYPTQYYLHHGGVHGTPIRMIDWRQSLNFILSNRCNANQSVPSNEHSEKILNQNEPSQI